MTRLFVAVRSPPDVVALLASLLRLFSPIRGCLEGLM
jgi:hypothetical protein